MPLLLLGRTNKLVQALREIVTLLSSPSAGEIEMGEALRIAKRVLGID